MKNLSHFLNKIKIGCLKKATIIEVNFNKKWPELLKILYNEGFIQNYLIKDNKIYIYLRYYQNKNSIRYLKNFLKTSNTLYIKKKNLWLFQRYNGTLILSTVKGYKTHEECLRQNLGGKVLFFIG
jgi:Ribosomal protein S8